MPKIRFFSGILLTLVGCSGIFSTFQLKRALPRTVLRYQLSCYIPMIGCSWMVEKMYKDVTMVEYGLGKIV